MAACACAKAHTGAHGAAEVNVHMGRASLTLSSNNHLLTHGGRERVFVPTDRWGN